MRMVVAVAIAALGGLVLAGGLSATTDLRGWPSGSGGSADILRPARAGDPPFTISDCLPWTVDLNALPGSAEYQGAATETLVACRSQSGFVRWLSLYGLVVSAGLIWKAASRRRRRRSTRGLS